MGLPLEIAGVTLGDALNSSCSRAPDRIAFQAMDGVVTYQDIAQRTDAMACALLQSGLNAGDRVGLYCINSIAFIVSYFGVIKAGGTVVPINLLLNPKEAAYNLNDAGIHFFIYHQALTTSVQSIVPALPEGVQHICIGDAPLHTNDLLYKDMLQTKGVPPALHIDPADEVAAILYTSGTTGYPKGAMLTHLNLLSNTWSMDQALHLDPGSDAFLLVLPMFHAFAATVGMIFPLLFGIRVVTLPRFDPAETVKVIEKEGVSVFLGVPSMYNLLLRLPEAFTSCLAGLKYGVSGGAAMPAEVMDRFEERFGKAIYEGDGPTECSPATSVNPIGGTRKPLSIGLPIPLVEMKIVDEEGQELPRGEIGEICVRGPNIMKGYYNRPEDTSAIMLGDWLRTGDLGTEDLDGYFFIVDRKKDMIIVNGMNVYPRMIEELLYKHPVIQEVAVVGEPHDSHGEIVVAYVVCKDDSACTAADLRTYCQEHLGRFEVPRKFIFMDALPKNAAGKIVKRQLRKHGEMERGIKL